MSLIIQDDVLIRYEEEPGINCVEVPDFVKKLRPMAFNNIRKDSPSSRSD